MLYFFFLATTLDLVGAFAYQPLHFVCKPFLMPALMIYFWRAIDRRLDNFARWIIGALFFSWLGDVFLIFEGKGFFIGGLGSFLLAHVLYLGAYRDALPIKMPRKRLLAQKPYIFVPFLAYLAGFYSFLFPYLGNLAIPVAVYAVVLMCMGLLALDRRGFTSQASYQWILAGAFFFMASDSILATNLFVFAGKLPLGNGFVMFTYLAAQYAIARGAIMHTKAKR